MSNKKGQVAVILILVVAAALIFYAVSINLGRVSQTKTLTAIAADTGASQLASYMASFGQSIYKTTLGGNREVCGLTGVLVSIFVVIIAIAAAIWTGGASLALLSLALAVTALVIQVAVIQPGLSDAWNDKIWATMDMEDAFVEQGIQKALGAVATDSGLIPDLDDSDGDRVWGQDINGQFLDTIGRFGFYYDKQRLNTIAVPPSGPIGDFLVALDDFLYVDAASDWGIFDGTGPVCDPFNTSSECNNCCVPPAVRSPDIGCGLPGNNAIIQQECEERSPYGNGISSDYPWVYDAYRGNPVNAFVSFQEQLGRDDEHRGYRKVPADPNGYQNIDPGNAFRLEDTTGFYTPTVYLPADNRTGIFPFFYKISDWGVNLDPIVLVTNSPTNPQCNWCDERGGTTCDPAAQPAEIPQLVLPPDALNSFGVNTPAGANLNTTYCVDGTNLVSGNPPLAVDKVKLPDATTGRIEADSDQCAQSALGNPGTGFWKRGGDRFCGTAWPYGEECNKYGSPFGMCRTRGTGCACGFPGTQPPDNTNNWPDDLVDDVLYGLEWFIDWARETLSKDPELLGREFKNWYPEVADWIEPGGLDWTLGRTATCEPSSSPSPNPPGATCCYVCPADPGKLFVWYNEIREMNSRLRAWRDTSFAGATCTDVWCVPLASAGCPAGRDSTVIGGSGPEANTFGTGTMEDVVNCLDWNVADAGGNAVKFQNCETACATSDYATANLWCGRLPRSLVPLFDGTYTPANSSYLACPGTCSTCYDGCPVSCAASCAGAADPPGCTTACTSTCQTACCASAFCTCAGGCGCGDVRASGACYAAGLPAAQGSCLDPAFRAGVQQSIPEAQNQVAKFRKRHIFLSGRLAELDRAISVLDAAEDRFYQFLTCDDNDGNGEVDGAACRLIKARIAFDSREKGLPYHAIYGWQSKAEEGEPIASGKWHIVRVDARIPGRCDKSCNADQVRYDPLLRQGGDPLWPRVTTDVDNWGTRRCYTLSDTDGVVKMRVTRFDETGAFATLFFPNAVEIWKPTFERLDRPLSISVEGIEPACTRNMMPDPGALQAFPGSNYYGAFMLNKRIPYVRDPVCVEDCDGNAACEAGCPLIGNIDCWDLANRLLSSGVTGEACARYYYHEGGVDGMDFKFVPCANF